MADTINSKSKPATNEPVAKEKLRLKKRSVEETTVQAKGGGKINVTIKKSRKSRGASKLTAKKEAEVQPVQLQETSPKLDSANEEQLQVASEEATDAASHEAVATTADATEEAEQLASTISPEQLAQAEVTRREAQQQRKDLESQERLKVKQKKKDERKNDVPEKVKHEKAREKNTESSDFTRRQKLQRKERDGKLSRSGDYTSENYARRRKTTRVQTKLKRNAKLAESGLFERPDTFVSKEIEVPALVTVSDLARLMSLKTGDLISILLKMGVVKTINEILDQDTAVLAIEEAGHKARLMLEKTAEEQHEAEQSLLTEDGEPRAPIVTVMGHVDHGKTSLLDHIRKTRVASAEAGGITQHIGAYHVSTAMGDITFLDTPGHADFTAMRARGAKLTDIVILMVAVDDGVMPQTIEAIQHAKAADVPIIVAISKIDLENADMERIKADLAAQDLAPEEWGGQAQLVPISTVTGQGISELLEAIILQAELLELKAVVDTPARGRVIESRLDKGGGPIASLLVTQGRLAVGDAVVSGESFGRIRAMINEHGQRIQDAKPAMPVEVLGFNAIPEVGDTFSVVANDKKAKELVEFRHRQSSEQKLASHQATRLEDIFENQGSSDKTLVNLIIKTDVRGSLEAIEQAVHKLNNDEIQVNVASKGVGGITESDALFARTSNAILFGFNVRADSSAKKVIESYGLNLRYYSVIYNLVDDLKVILSGMMAPELREHIVGTAEVRNIFNSQRYGLIAGCMVTTGNVHRNKKVRVLRSNVVIYEGDLESLRRVKEDVEEVRNGVECGIGIRNYRDVRVGDVIETFDIQEIARTL